MYCFCKDLRDVLNTESAMDLIEGPMRARGLKKYGADLECGPEPSPWPEDDGPVLLTKNCHLTMLSLDANWTLQIEIRQGEICIPLI
jgi:hypothetical protein